MFSKSPLLLTIGLAISLSASTAIVTPEPAEAFDLKKVTNKFKKSKVGKNIKKSRKKLKQNIRRVVKNPSAKKVLQGAGVALVVGGFAKNSPAAAIIGVALVAAPELIKKDIAKSYKKDLNWSGCTRCTKSKPRAVVTPGRKVDKKQQAASISRVKEDIKDVQLALQELGLYKKGIDGDFGPGTRAGVKEFQRSVGARETGVLTAEQRHRLFLQAEKKGYKRQAVLNKIDNDKKQSVSALASAAVITPSVLAPTLVSPNEKRIEEYKLADSQFQKFSQEYLLSGNQSQVKQALLMPDGKIQLTIVEANGDVGKTITGFINDIKINPHKLSDQWIRIVFEDGSLSDPVILNTRDDFPTSKVALNWMEQANGKKNILAKLTEIEPNNPDVRIASAKPPVSHEKKKNEDSEKTPNNTQAENINPPTSDTYKADKNGSIQIADSVTSTPVNNNNRLPVSQSAAKPDTKPIQTSLTTKGFDTGNELTGFDPQLGSDVCQQNIYVSFSFPDGENPISHYNVIPPEGTIMIDNGDSTAYFTGACIQGSYDFSYVYIQEAAKKENWKHFKREGSFQIASNNEQCTINLNQPQRSARLQCF